MPIQPNNGRSPVLHRTSSTPWTDSEPKFDTPAEACTEHELVNAAGGKPRSRTASESKRLNGVPEHDDPEPTGAAGGCGCELDTAGEASVRPLLPAGGVNLIPPAPTKTGSSGPNGPSTEAAVRTRDGWGLRGLLPDGEGAVVPRLQPVRACNCTESCTLL